MAQPIVFVSDLGLRDESVGVHPSVLALSAAEQLGVRNGDPAWIVLAD